MSDAASAAPDYEQLCAQALDGFTLDDLPPTIQVPALPAAVMQFLQVSEDPDAPVSELARIIESDGGLTVELLKFVNSTFVGLRQKTERVGQTLALLGVRRARSFVLSTGMQAAVRSRQAKLVNQKSFWSESLQRAIFAKTIAGRLGADTEAAFTGAMLQDFLLPVVTTDLADDYQAFLDDRDAQPESLCEFERDRFGWDHTLAAASLARRWHLPSEMVCGILFHHHGTALLQHPDLARTSLAAIALSGLIPGQLQQQKSGAERLAELDAGWPGFDLAGLAAEVDRQQDENGLGIANDFPLTRRLAGVLEPAAV